MLIFRKILRNNNKNLGNQENDLNIKSSKLRAVETLLKEQSSKINSHSFKIFVI